MSKATMAHSYRELGDAVGRSHSVVQRWTKRDDWNQSRTPPWDVEKAKAWSKRLAPNRADVDPGSDASGAAAADAVEHLRRNPLSAARLKLAVVRAQKLEIEKQILTGEFVLRGDVEQALIRRVHAARAAFEALPRQAAAALVGQDENMIEERLAAIIENVLGELGRQIKLPAPRLENNDDH